MVQVAKLSADLTANTSNFETGLKRANSALSNSTRLWSGALSKSASSFLTVEKGVAGLTGGFALLASSLAGLLGGAGFAAITMTAINAASALNDTAQRLQITTDQLQSYQYAARLAGVDAETLETALTKLNAKIGEGSFKYKDASEGLLSIADAVKNAKSDTEKLAIVNDAFGNKMGAKLLPVLSDGAAGLKEMGLEAQRTGNVISSDVIQKTDAFGDSLDALGSTITKNFQQGFLNSLVGESKTLKDIYSDPKFAENIKTVGSAIGYVAEKALQAVGKIGELIERYKELNSGSYGLDEKLFNGLDNLDKKLGRTPVKKEKFGPPEPFGPVDNPQFRATQTEYESSKKILEAKSKAEAAAKKAAADAQRQTQARKDLLDSLSEENRQLQIQTSMYGQKESAISRAQKEQQINNQLARDGITLSQEQRDQVDKYLDSIERQTELQSEQEKQQKRLEDQERNRQQALDQLGATFESGFEDAIFAGEKLSNVFTSLLEDILKLQIRKSFIEPLFSSVTGEGGLGGLFSKILPSFAVGTPYVPNDMVANIHKGEMIIPAKEAAALRRGGNNTSGPVFQHTYNFAPGVSRAELAQIIPQIQQSTQASVLEAIGRGGKFSQAVGRRA